LWLVIVLLSFFWNARQVNRQYHDLALQSTRSFFKQLILTREWAAQHDGVYVPVTEKTQPNPFLDKRMRDLRINDDLLFIKINPSFMTRQLAELAASHDDIQFRLTSLDPIRPQNKPTQWEKNALRQFQQGVAEISEMLESVDTN